jgi:hypothetical protein
MLRGTLQEEYKKLMRFNQTVIKHALSDFIMLEGYAKEENTKKLASALKSHGFCFGFSICNGVMDNVNKLAWWK